MATQNENAEFFEWMCPSEGCRHKQTERVDEYGPSMTLVCGKCDQWFGEKDLRPEERKAWADALAKTEAEIEKQSKYVEPVLSAENKQFLDQVIKPAWQRRKRKLVRGV